MFDHFKTFSTIKTEIKFKIRIFHVFNDERINCENDKNILFITTEDKVFGLGPNSHGMCGLGHNNVIDDPMEINELTHKKIRKFYIGKNFVIAKSKDSKMYTWGVNDKAQVAIHYSSQSDLYFKPILLSEHIKKISCGDYHAICMDEEGVVRCWGDIDLIKSDCNETNWPKLNSLIASNEVIKSIYCHRNFIFIMTLDGQIYLWPVSKEKSTRGPFTQTLSSKIIDIRGAIDICFSKFVTYILTEQSIYYFWHNNYEIANEIINKSSIDEKILKLYSVNGRAVAVSEDYVYYFMEDELIKTDHHTLFQYYAKCFQITYKTIDIQEEKMSLKDKIQYINVIGYGAFGKVMKARMYHQDYAVKKVDIERMYKKLDDKNCELNIMMYLRSEFVVRLYEYWIDDDFLHMIMELCDDNLDHVIKFKNLAFNGYPAIDFVFCCEIMKEISEALDYLHGRRPPIIHRDLKPFNILIKYRDNEGRFVKLCDFGFSITHESGSTSHTSIIGTPKYCAPEVKNGRKYTEKADIFSMGILCADLFAINPPKAVQRKLSKTFNRFRNFFHYREKKRFDKKLTSIKNLIKDMTNEDYIKRPPTSQIISNLNIISFNMKETEKLLYKTGLPRDIEEDEGNFIKNFLNFKIFKQEYVYNEKSNPVSANTSTGSDGSDHIYQSLTNYHHYQSLIPTSSPHTYEIPPIPDRRIVESQSFSSLPDTKSCYYKEFLLDCNSDHSYLSLQ